MASSTYFGRHAAIECLRSNSLEQQMREKEPQVECRVARVGTFEVKQNEPLLMHQDVLGAEIAQHQRALAFRPDHRGDQCVDLRFQIGMGARDRSIVRVDAKLVEEAGVGENALE